MSPQTRKLSSSTASKEVADLEQEKNKGRDSWVQVLHYNIFLVSGFDDRTMRLIVT